MTATIAQALTEITQVLTNGFAGTIIVPNDDKTPPDAHDVVWAQIRFEHTSRGQASLSNENGKRRWGSDGICTIQLNFPYGKGVKMPYDEAERIARLYEGKRTPSDVWFRNVTVVEVPTPTAPKPKHFRLDVVFEFQYDSVN